jgi:hypothetical protein
LKKTQKSSRIFPVFRQELSLTSIIDGIDKQGLSSMFGFHSFDDWMIYCSAFISDLLAAVFSLLLKSFPSVFIGPYLIRFQTFFSFRLIEKRGEKHFCSGTRRRRRSFKQWRNELLIAHPASSLTDCKLNTLKDFSKKERKNVCPSHEFIIALRKVDSYVQAVVRMENAAESVSPFLSYLL